jgi:hypothetical protein
MTLPKPFRNPPCDKPPESIGVGGRDERRTSAPQDENARIDCRLRHEDASGQAAREARLEERAPVDTVQGAWPWHGSLDCHVPLDDEIGSREAAARLEEHAEKVGGAVEWKVCDHAKRLLGQCGLGGIRDHDVDVVPPAAEGTCEVRVDLDRDNAIGYACELFGEPAEARSDLDDEIAAADAGLADDLGCERVAAKEVLATRRRPSRPMGASAGHGSAG